MNTQKLQQVRDAMQELLDSENNVHSKLSKFEFDMHVVKKEEKCGTAGCIAGVVLELFNVKHNAFTGLSAAGDELEMDHDESDALFDPCDVYDDKDVDLPWYKDVDLPWYKDSFYSLERAIQAVDLMIAGEKYPWHKLWYYLYVQEKVDTQK